MRPGGPEKLRREACWHWRSPPGGRRRQQGCRPQHLDPDALAAVFAGARLTLVGDSHVRYLYSRLSLRLGGNYSVEKFHEDRFSHLPGTETELAMYWKTLSRNQTLLLREWAERGASAPSPPDLLVLGGGSWDIWLESKNVTVWEQSVDRLAAAVRRYLEALRARGARAPVLVWATTPLRVKGRALLEEEVPAELIPQFNAPGAAGRALWADRPVRLDQRWVAPWGWLAGLGVARHGRRGQSERRHTLFPSPFAECFEWCVPDGTHGSMAINDIAIQILANLYSHARHRQDQLLLEERRRWGQGLHGAANLLRRFVRAHVMRS